MAKPKSNTRPFWWVVTLLLLLLLFQIGYFITYQQTKGVLPKEFLDELTRSLVRQFVIADLVLMIECAAYWWVKDRISTRSWVWIHIASLYYFFLVDPYFIQIVNTIQLRRLNPEQYQVWKGDFDKIKMIFSLFALFIGHLFFVLTIVNAFKKRQEFTPPE